MSDEGRPACEIHRDENGDVFVLVAFVFGCSTLTTLLLQKQRAKVCDKAMTCYDKVRGSL